MMSKGEMWVLDWSCIARSHSQIMSWDMNSKLHCAVTLRQLYNQQLSKVSIIRNIKCTVEMTSTQKNSHLELRFFLLSWCHFYN